MFKSNVISAVTAIGITMVSLTASANKDVKAPHEREVTLKDVAIAGVESYGTLSQSQASVKTAELVVFYQPSYLTYFNEYEMYRRVETFVESLNTSMGKHGLTDFKVEVSDIVPVTSVPDSLPYDDKKDENGEIIQDGAGYLFSNVVLNEFSVVDGEWVENPEYKIYQQKWKGDLVLYLRERRADNDVLGYASLGGELSTVFDETVVAENSLVLAHEIGHNLNLNHEEAEASQGPEYARAWECGGKRTIMYSSSPYGEAAAGHFSDPSLSIDGEACGDEETGYNAKVISETFVATTQRREGVAKSGTVEFADTAITGNESEGIQFTLVRAGDTTEPASVKVLAENGDAVYGEDFIDAFVIAEFAAGEAEVSVTYPMVADADEEGIESLQIYLDYGYKLDIGEQSVADVSLLDGDVTGAGGMVSITGDNVVEEGQSLTLTVSRNGGVGEIVVNVITETPDAYPGVDYVSLDERLTFAEGEVEKQVTFESVQDTDIEPSKLVYVKVSSPNTGVTYSPDSLAITLLSDDMAGAGFFYIAPEVESVAEDAGTVDVVISRESGIAAAELELEVTIQSTTNIIPVSFEENEELKTVSIDIPDNDTDESNYYMYLTLSSEDPAVNIESGEAELLIEDNDTSSDTGGESPQQPGDSSSGGGGSTGIFMILLCAIGVVLKRRI